MQVESPPGAILFGRTALKERDQNSVATNDPVPPTNPESLGYDERCSDCCQAPCVTVNNLERKGSRAPDIINHSFRHKDYRKYWKFLKDIGF